MKERKRIENIRKFYIWTIVFLFFGLVFSKLAISLAQFSLLGLWFIDKNYKSKLLRLKQDKSTLIFLSIFALFLIGMTWSSDWNYGTHDLKIKLPILVIPFVIASSKPITKKELNFLLLTFIILIFAKTIESLYILLSNKYITSIGEISNKISHIRMSLMINLAIFSTIYLIKQKFFKKRWEKNISFLLILWFILSLIAIQSLTGIIIFILINLGISFFYFIKKKNKIIKYSYLFIIIIIPISVTLYLNNQISEFYNFKDPTYENLPILTEQGNKYKHDSTIVFVENGYKVGYYYCEKELKKEWNKISSIKFDSIGENGYKVKHTLIRYLTSMGLPKDSVGVSMLTKDDVIKIEKGFSNYKFTNVFNINDRIYKVIWQFYVYKRTKNPNNQSITQRIEFLKTAFHIIKDNKFFGVGTGDVKQAFANQYIKDNSILKDNNRYRSHNQYVSFIVALGFIGGLWCIIALFLPYFINKKWQFLPTAFFVIAILSMLDEDTLETSIGISFFAIFYTLLILQKNIK